ncbi:MAG: gamma-glutamylcyclotransferase [Planctomycetes bacterium]|nr:gamma-glutamylcyclotransferase [Planctomycetota bacterium]
MAQRKHYFAYGESMNVNRLKKWLSQRGGRPDGIVSAQRAVLKGWSLVFNVRREVPWKAGVANLEKDPNGTVEGVLLEVDNAAESLVQQKEGPGWKRVQVDVVGDKEKSYGGVQTFVAAQPEAGKTHAPAKAYMEILLEAAKAFEFGAEYLKKLEGVKVAE